MGEDGTSRQKGEGSAEKAMDSLDEGTKALATRQKHIQLADHSEYSWSTVKLHFGRSVPYQHVIGIIA